MINADNKVVILSDRAVAAEWAKNTDAKVVAVPLDTVFSQPEKKAQ